MKTIGYTKDKRPILMKKMKIIDMKHKLEGSVCVLMVM